MSNRWLLGMITTLLFLSGVVSAQNKTERKARQVISSEMSRLRVSQEKNTVGSRFCGAQHVMELKSFLDFADTQDDGYKTMVYDFVESYMDKMIGEEGRVLGRVDSLNDLTDLMCGSLLFRVNDYSGKAKYRLAMDSLRKEIERQPRTVDGGFWPDSESKEQVWIDRLYYYAPFYAEYAQWYESGEKRAMSMDDVEHQLCLAYNRTYCGRCNLLHHAWDADTVSVWANPKNGRGDCVWGRAEGLYLMALIDYLDVFEAKSSKYYSQEQGVIDSLVYIFQSLCSRMAELQSPECFMWKQLPNDTVSAGNDFESSVTAMMAYVFLKGSRMGFLDKYYQKAGTAALRELEDRFVDADGDDGVILDGASCDMRLRSDVKCDAATYIKALGAKNSEEALSSWIMALTELSIIGK